MSFNSKTTIEEMNQSMNAMLLLHSSCQAIIEAEIASVNSKWYKTLDQDLGNLENLVVNWRENGYLYFHQQILQETGSYAKTFTASQKTIDGLIDKLIKSFNQTNKQDLETQLNNLLAPLKAMSAQIADYRAKLKVFETKILEINGGMEKTVAEVQAEESQIESEIKSINEQIDELEKTIKTDRTAIAKAKQRRKRGIIETIFGIILAPFSLGASLVLAGIGVATIAEAEEKIHQLQNTINSSITKIASDQKNLSKDEKIIASLKGLLMSSNVAIHDVSLIYNNLDTLRTTWDEFQGEINQEIIDLNKSKDSKDIVLIQAWFNAAANQWRQIQLSTSDLNQRTINSTHIKIG